MTQVAALFVDPKGVYPKLLGAEHCWGEARDARKYVGPHPVVAHPPCARWCRLAESVFARTRKEEHRPGNDGGCFASALKSVRSCGGVIEHPASSKAWTAFGIEKPVAAGWRACNGYWTCEVWQSAYGHLAPKRTWLVYVGQRAPFELRWDRTPGTHVVGGDTRKRRTHPNPPPRLTGKQSIATPLDFAHVLLALAEWSRTP